MGDAKKQSEMYVYLVEGQNNWWAMQIDKTFSFVK